jgi:hypothetical protein
VERLDYQILTETVDKKNTSKCSVLTVRDISQTFSFLFMFLFFSFLFFRLNADAKVPNLKGITVDKIFGPSTPSAPSGGGEAVAAGGKTYGISRAANAFYAQTRSTVLTRPEVRALGELLVNDRDPIVAMAPKGNHRFVFTNLR